MPPYATATNLPAGNPSEAAGKPQNNYNPPNSLAENDIGYSFGTYDPLADVETVEPAANLVLGFAGLAFAIPSRRPVGDSGRTITFDYTFTAAPSAITVELQGAMRNIDYDFRKIADQATFTTTPNSQTVTGVRFRFLRLKITALTLGGGAGIIGRILT